MLSVAISPYIGIALTLAPGAKLDDRHFDVVVREAAGRADMVRHAATMLFGIQPRSPGAVTLRGRHISVDHLDGPMLVHADGELVGRTPAELELLPGALAVVAAPPGRGEVPAGAPTRARRTPAAPTRSGCTTTPPAAPGRPRQPR